MEEKMKTVKPKNIKQLVNIIDISAKKRNTKDHEEKKRLEVQYIKQKYKTKSLIKQN